MVGGPPRRRPGHQAQRHCGSHKTADCVKCPKGARFTAYAVLVEAGSFGERANQQMLFLMDGFCRTPSPVLLIVGETAAATRIALAVHDGSTRWDSRPARVGKLMRLDSAAIAADPVGDFAALLAGVARTDHWFYLPDIHSLVESPVGGRFLDDLMTLVGDGGAAAVIASTTREHLPKLQAEAPRIMGFASILHHPVDSDSAGLTFFRSIVVRSTDQADVGWMVAVRYDLAGAVQTDTSLAADPADNRLRLVDAAQMIVRDGKPPLGAIISLTPDAFSVLQQDAAFATASRAAERLVGRRLGPEERSIAVRAIFYA